MKKIGRLFTSPYKIGDHVVHGLTNRYGRVSGIEKCNGTMLLTVDLDGGGQMRKVDRREFMLANHEHPSVVREQENAQIAEKFLGSLDVKDGFSHDSIIEEII